MFALESKGGSFKTSPPPAETEQEREGSTNDTVYLKDERNNTFTLAVMIQEKKIKAND